MNVGTSLHESSVIAGQNGPFGAEIALSDDGLYEVVDGQVVEKPVGAEQSEIASILAQLLGTFARLNRQGRVLIEVLYRIDQAKDLQRRPDVSFVSHGRWPIRRRVPKKVAAWDMVPDQAIEVVSRSNSAESVQRKMHAYFAAGSRQVWVVYPEEHEIYAYTSTRQVQIFQVGDELDGGDLLPGFRLPFAALFEDEPEVE